MTTATEIEAPASASDVVWACVTRGFWTAHTDGDFLGTIEQVETRYVAADAYGNVVGVVGSLDVAKARVAQPPAYLAEDRLRVHRRDQRWKRIAASVAALSAVTSLTALVAGLAT